MQDKDVVAGGTQDQQIAIAFRGRGTNIVRMDGFSSVEDACEAILERDGLIWGVVQVGQPFNWKVIYKYSRKYGLRSVEEIERCNQDRKTKQTKGN